MLVEIVRESRGRTSDVFPLPDIEGCIDYAITEAGECLDAILRDNRLGDKRNRDKAHDARREWGQCGYMILSALIQMPPEAMNISYTGDESVYDMLTWLCLYQNAEDDTALLDALQEWVNLCDREGWDAADLLHETCQAFEAKHGPKKIPYPVLSAEEAEA